MNHSHRGRSASSRNLATTLALALVSLSILALILAISPQLVSNIQSQQAAITGRQQIVAQDAARTVHDFTEQRLNMLNVASRLSNLTAEQPARQTEVLQRLLGLEPSFTRLVLLDTQGRTTAQASRIAMSIAHDLESTMFGDAMRRTQQGERYVSPVFIDSITSEPEVLIAVPVTNVFGETQGTLTAIMNLKFMWDLVDRLAVGEGGLAYVVDRQGNLLAFSDTARVLRGENVAHIHTVREFMESSNSHEMHALQRYTGIMGSDVVGSYAALEMPDWAVITEMPWSIAYRGVIHSIGLAIAIGLGAAILAGVLGVYLSRRLTSPLVSLMNTANRIAAGERDLQVAVHGPREVTALALAFNAMTTQLRSTLQGLEQHVVERTADLQVALTELETRSNEQALLLEENMQQRQAIRELSVPVLPVTLETVVLPLVGAIDTERLTNIQERALQALQQTSARYLLLDITGVPVVDSQVAQGLLSVAQMARLLGSEAVLIGVRPEVAQTLVGLGLDLTSLRTAANLQTMLHNLNGKQH